MNSIVRTTLLSAATLVVMSLSAGAQKYGTLVDKTVAVVGNEMISVSNLEQEIQTARTQGASSDRNMRCEILESMMTSKLFLMQARIDSLEVNADMVEGELSNRIDQIRTALGGDEEAEAYFGKPLYKLRQEWRKQFEDMSLTQQEQQQLTSAVLDATPYDVKQYLDSVNVDDLPMVPTKYRLSQICIYPDREAANLAVKEKLLSLRERIINGEKFSTLARLYSEDPGSARKGGELGMASKSIFWPAFSDAAMSLRPGTISQIVETPDGFHIIEVIDKKGDMFNARHILIKPKYTADDRDRAFKTLDSLRAEIQTEAISFPLAVQFYSQDDATKTNGGQMADPSTGSSYFEIDQLKPEDYAAINGLKEGEISQPFESKDNEGRDGNLVYKIIRLDKVLPAHTAAFETDFNDLAAAVKGERQGAVIREFIDKKIESTNIKIDPIFKDCQFDRPGWKEKFTE